MKLPDVGEGVAEAEIVEWRVDVGDEVTPDTVLAEVLTDKATVEVSAPVAGTVVARYGEAGDVLAVGSVLIGIETADGVTPEPATEPPAASEPPAAADPPAITGAKRSARVLAAPAVRRRADELGIGLAGVSGSGPDGRIVHADLDRLLVGGRAPSGDLPGRASDGPRVEAVRGIRRRIAERLSATWSEIPHITYVEAVDVTELEALRSELNAPDDGRARLTMLPFIVRAIVVACRDQPEINAHYDHASETLTVHGAVHVGIATQTDQGLMVPVLRHAESLDLRGTAEGIARGRRGSAERALLARGAVRFDDHDHLARRDRGVATTPILNAPEVAIIGVNKMEVRPVWRDETFQPRTMINLSSSFDHRVVDGWDAARFIQRLKTLLETPALLFVD
jgi:2-oxoisovalerate dehydrogenase E2 component (dihydrolipoyl transacylase)